jgi:hypothetical protein
MLPEERLPTFREKMKMDEEFYPYNSPLELAILKLVDYVTTMMRFDLELMKDESARDASKHGIDLKHIRVFFDSYPYPSVDKDGVEWDEDEREGNPGLLKLRLEERAFMLEVRKLFQREGAMDRGMFKRNRGRLTRQRLNKAIRHLEERRAIKERKGRYRLNDSLMNASLPARYKKLLREAVPAQLRPYAKDGRTLFVYPESLGELPLGRAELDALEADLLGLVLKLECDAEALYREHMGEQPKLPPGYYDYWDALPVIVMDPCPTSRTH